MAIWDGKMIFNAQRDFSDLSVVDANYGVFGQSLISLSRVSASIKS